MLTEQGAGNYPNLHQLQDLIFNLQSHIVHIRKPIVFHIFNTTQKNKELALGAILLELE